MIVIPSKTKPAGSLGQLQAFGAGSTFVGTGGLVYDSATGTLTHSAAMKNTVGIGTISERLASASGNAVRWSHVVNKNNYVGTGVGGENYTNEVMLWGWNSSDTIGVRADATKSACYDSLEYKYNDAGKYIHERHMEAVTTDGGLKRFASWGIPHDGGSGSAFLSGVDRIIWYTFGLVAVKLDFQLQNNLAYIGSNTTGFRFIFEKNNSSVLQQRNAANTAYVSLPYYNAADELLMVGRARTDMNGSPPAGQGGVTYNFSTANFAAGACHMLISGAAVTGKSIDGINRSMSTDFVFSETLRNLHASGRVRDYLWCGATGAASTFWQNGTSTWAGGINSSGNWFLGSDEFASDDVMRVNKTNREVLFIKPPRRPQPVAVASLPAAATYPWGMATVNDATMTHILGIGTVVAGGNSNSVPVYSDGTNWRIG